jgi:hypothetical protein
MGSMAVPAVMGLSAEVANRQAQRERIFEEEPPETRQSLQRSKSMNTKLTNPASPGIKETVIRVTTSASLDVRRPSSMRSPTIPLSPQRSSSATHFSNKHSQLMSQSQPNLQPPSPTPFRPSPLRPVSPSAFTDENITKTLHTHYYSTQMQFLQCLQDISLRLRLVPKAARQSALRMELGGLDKWLPADVCLANICPSNDVHDRVVQIVESECTILNSAERVINPQSLPPVLISGTISITSRSIKRGPNIFASKTKKSKTLSRYNYFEPLRETIRSQYHPVKNITRSMARRTLSTQ